MPPINPYELAKETLEHFKDDPISTSQTYYALKLLVEDYEYFTDNHPDSKVADQIMEGTHFGG